MSDLKKRTKPAGGGHDPAKLGPLHVRVFVRPA